MTEAIRNLIERVRGLKPTQRKERPLRPKFADVAASRVPPPNPDVPPRQLRGNIPPLPRLQRLLTEEILQAINKLKGFNEFGIIVNNRLGEVLVHFPSDLSQTCDKLDGITSQEPCVPYSSDCDTQDTLIMKGEPLQEMPLQEFLETDIMSGANRLPYGVAACDLSNALYAVSRKTPTMLFLQVNNLTQTLTLSVMGEENIVIKTTAEGTTLHRGFADAVPCIARYTYRPNFTGFITTALNAEAYLSALDAQLASQIEAQAV